MGRPSKGARKAVIIRLPLDLIHLIALTAPTDRTAWVVEAIEEKLRKDGALP